MRVVHLLSLAFAGFVTWLAAFSFKCYYRGWSEIPSKHPRDHVAPYPGGTNDNIFWFLQISDIHLSIVNDFEVKEDLESFCTETLSTISPALVLVTGDLTHAKYSGERYSKQFEEEWKVYGDVLRETRAIERQPWLDIRGNHDDFDVESRSHPGNLYLRHSPSSFSATSSSSTSSSSLDSTHRDTTHSYSYTHSTTFGSYRFIGMDACPSPGPRRPLNFFGVLHNEDLLALRSIVEETHSSSSSSSSSSPNSTVWFSHYPTATIVADHAALRHLMSTASVHVCGHLHDLLGLTPILYSRHPSGHLELELIDFKDHRGYRLMAVDHDIVSFVDTQLNRWPLVLVTNPKDARFAVPDREPLGRVIHSSHIRDHLSIWDTSSSPKTRTLYLTTPEIRGHLTHVPRVLAFAPDGVRSVLVWLDGRRLPQTTRVEQGPLYTTPWDPNTVASGLHTITVVAEDMRGNIHNSSHQFSLDGHLLPLETIPQLLLLTDVKSLLQMLFLFFWLSLLATLLLSWVNRARQVYFQPLVRKKSVFLPLTLLILYIGIGPWCVGEMMTGVYGLILVHGILVSNQFIPGSITYLYGILQMVTWYIPLTLYLNHLLSHTHSSSSSSSASFRPFFTHFLIFFLFLYHCGWLLTFLPYSAVALILSPGLSWTLPLSIYLVLRARRRNN